MLSGITWGGVVLTVLLGGVAEAAAQNAAQTPEATIEQDRLIALIERLPPERAINGDAESVAGLAATADLIERELAALGYQVQEQEVVWAPRMRPAEGEEPRSVTSRNLWVDIPGQDTPGEVIVLAAHYDAVPGSPGADDNGTGVAVNLELARVLRERPMARTVRLLFPTAEEVGLVGAFRYAEEIAGPAMAAGRERIVGMISLEMLGYFSDEPGSQSGPQGLPPGIADMLAIPETGDFIAVVGILPHVTFHGPLVAAMRRAEPGLKVVTTGALPAPIGDMARSDHAAFWSIGVPAVMLTDTANFRNPHYHRATDTVETLDAERLTMVGRAVAEAVRTLAGEPDEEASEEAAEQAAP